MKPRIEIGLIAGAVGATLTACVSFVVGLCGPAMALLVGAVAGYLAARQEALPARAEGARAGAAAGGIAGAVTVVGQVIGALGSLVLAQRMGVALPTGAAPSLGTEVEWQIMYYAGGLASGVCFGAVGTFLAALAGAVAGYLGTTERPATVF